MNTPHKIGITGGIGCGKSTIARMFSEMFAIPHYDCDSRAKLLMSNSPELQEQLTELLGSQTYTINPENKELELNRAFVASKIFGNPELKSAMEAIVHPAVQRDFEQWTQSYNGSEHNYVIKESAILFQSNAHIGLDSVIVVDAPLDTRIQRVMNRDNCSQEQVISRIEAQMPAEQLISIADYVIYNGPNTPVMREVVALHKNLINFAKQNQ